MNSTPDSEATTAKPAYHHSGVRCVRTIDVILSVIEPKVWPGAITARSAAPATRACAAFSCGIATLFTQLRVHVADRGEIRGTRPRVELGEERVVAHLGLELRHAARFIVQVAEHDRLRRTGLLAGGLDLAIADAAALLFALDLRLVDPLHAVGALLHHAAAADG